MKAWSVLAVLLAMASVTRAEDPVTLEEQIEVTARRLARSVEATGATISVVDSEDLDARHTRSAADAVGTVPGAFVSRGSAGTPTSLFLRGAASNQTVVLVDGVQVNDPTIGGQFNFYDLDLANVERVEVLRGAASSLYGSDAAGGVVNIVTRRGRGEPSGRFLLEGGSHRYRRAFAGASGGDDQLDFSIEGGWVRTDNAQADNEFGSDSLAASVGLRPLEELSIRLTGRYVDSRAADPWDFPFTEQIPKDRNVRRDRTSWLLATDVEGRITDWLSARARASRFRVSSLLTNGPDAPGDLLELRSRAIAVVDNLTLSMVAEVPGLPEWLDLTALLGWEAQDEESESRVNSAFGPSPPLDEKVRNRAFFGLVEVVLLDRLTLSGGARRDRNSDYGSETSLSGSALYTLDLTGTRLRANYGEAFRGPKPVELYDPYVGDPDLEPEESTSLDLGLEQEFAGGDLLLGATWFQLKTRDLIAYDPEAFVLRNVDRARTRGWELSGAGRPCDDLLLRVWATFQKPEDLGAGPGEEDRLPGRPGWFGGGEIRWHSGPLTASLLAEWSGDYPAPVRITPGGDRRRQPGRRFLLGLSVSVEAFPGIFVLGRVENITDDEWYPTETAPDGLGRRYILGLSAEF